MRDMSSSHGNQRVTDEQLLSAFETINGPFVTAGELEDVLPISRAAINKRLKSLLREGRVSRKKPTENMVGWWRGAGQEFDET